MERKEKIKGGYYLKAKCIQEAEIAHMPPYAREIWDWLLMKANFEGNKNSGVERGKVLTSYSEIQDGLHWKIGWRKVAYSKWQCEKTMKLLKRATMIATEKTTRGIVISIVNYDFYQDQKNYESHRRVVGEPQTSHTIHKEVYKEENKENTIPPISPLSKIKVPEELIAIGSLTLKKSFIDAKQKLYPPLNVEAEIRHCVDWHTSHNSGVRSWDRAIGNWLKIAFERLGVVGVKKKRTIEDIAKDPELYAMMEKEGYIRNGKLIRDIPGME